MAFSPVKSDTGAVVPFEYLPATAGDYTAGQLLTVVSGKLKALSADTETTPPYLCVFEGTAVNGDIIAVLRVADDLIYETTLAAQATSAAVGGKLQVASGGLQAKYSTGTGTFEIVSMDGTNAGDVVRGRFV